MNLKERFYEIPKTWLKVLTENGFTDSRRFWADYQVLKTMVKKKIQPVIEKNRVDNPGVAYQKYLNVDYWVFESLRRVYALGLHRKSHLQILDVGTGAGYFPFICNYYGHYAEAVDVPDNEMYNQIIAALGLNRYAQYVRPYQPVALGTVQYDLVTGFMICFNNHKTPEVWNTGEWDYFLTDMAGKHMRPGAHFFLGLNAESEAEPVHPAVLDFFRRNGARINQCEISLPAAPFQAKEKIGKQEAVAV